jgi:hypothetical protein
LQQEQQRQLRLYQQQQLQQLAPRQLVRVRRAPRMEGGLCVLSRAGGCR